MPTLAPGSGKTQKAWLWTYARDDRPFGGAVPRWWPIALKTAGAEIVSCVIWRALAACGSRQVQPTLRGRDVGDIGEPDPAWNRSREVARDQVRCNWQVVTPVGGARTARRRHDGADTVPTHHPLDPAAAGATALPVQEQHGRGDCRSGRCCLDGFAGSQSRAWHWILSRLLTGRSREAQ